MIVINNSSEAARKERERQDNDLGNDILLNPIVSMDKSFVILSGMTTDEAIIIKKGIIKRIQKEYGENFTTSEAVVIKDSTMIRMEQQRAAEEQVQYQIFVNKYFAYPFIYLMCLLFIVILWEAIKTKLRWN